MIDKKKTQMKLNNKISTSEKLNLFYDIIHISRKYSRILLIFSIIFISYLKSFYFLLLFLPLFINAFIVLYLHENLKLNEKDYKITKSQFKKNFFKRKYLAKKNNS